MNSKWKYSIGFRLGMLLAIIAAIAGIAGIAGIMGIAGIARVTDVLADKTRNTAALGEIRLLMNENRSQIMLALQHNPATSFSKMHDHPLSMHLDQVMKNRDRITALWKEYMAQELSARERTAAERYAEARTRYVGEGLMAAAAALESGDFEQANLILFRKINPLYEEAAENAGGDLVRMYSAEAAADAAIEAEQTLTFWRGLIVSVDLVGAIIAIVFGIWIVRGIVRPLSAVVRHVDQAVSSDDFSGAVSVPGECEVGLAARAFNSLMEKLRGVVVGMRGSTVQLAHTARDLLDTADQVKQASDHQSEAISATASAIEEISVSLSHTADNARASSAIAESSRSTLDEALKVTRASMSEMESTASAIRETREGVQQLAQSSETISGIVSVIKEIAEQTNLLALNAAIEAARAGELGRGFAVVADEVRKLAERTTQSTQEIASLIGNIQARIGKAATAMQSADERASQSVHLAARSGEALRRVATDSDSSLLHIQEIADALHEQDAAVREIAANVERIAQMTEQNSAAARHNHEVAGNLDQLSDGLREMALRFRVA